MTDDIWTTITRYDFASGLIIGMWIQWLINTIVAIAVGMSTRRR